MRFNHLLGALVCVAAVVPAGLAAAQEYDQPTPAYDETPVYDDGSYVGTPDAAPVPGVAPAATNMVYPAPGSPIPTLAYNYWYPAAGGAYYPARMYLCPRPVPLHVGYTYITYQGMAPHNFLYKHHKRYATSHPGLGTTYTWLRWR
jgi:hypothetical protein